MLTRLNAFTPSCLFNATAVQYLTSINHLKLILSHSPGGGTTLETPFSPVSFGKLHDNPFSRSRERLSHILWRTKKKTEKKQRKKQEKTSAKHIRIRLIGGCVNESCNSCATVVQVLQDLFYVLLHVLFYL